MEEHVVLRKLRIKPGQQVVVLHAPPEYRMMLDPAPVGLMFREELRDPCDVVQCFVRTRAELEQTLPTIVRNLTPGNPLWISFPKKSSQVQTDLTRDTGWDILGKLGLRPVSLIAVDKTWSAMAVKPKSMVKTSRSSSASASRESKYIDQKARTILPPPDLRTALKANPRAADAFKGLAFTNKKEYVVWILGARQPETRARRVKETIAKLKAGLRNPSDKPRK